MHYAGIVTTILLKTVMCVVFLRTAYAGFYRKMPAFANAFMFGMECWNIALTAAYVLSRVVKFLVATGLYAGRIDIPVLAEGLALDIDSLPRVFRQNLLSAEAIATHIWSSWEGKNHGVFVVVAAACHCMC